jgi:hypothetical protein
MKTLSIFALLLMVTTAANAQTMHTVTIKEGTEDYAKWTVAPNPAAAGQQVKVTYTGSMMVKSVKAKEAKTNAYPALNYNQKKNIADGAVTVKAGEHWLIEGDGSEVSNTITIGDGATVTLSNVNISDSSACITCSGSATIILADGTKNTLTNKGILDDYSALSAGPAYTTLTIQGSTGSLNVSSNGYGAGIGGGCNISCGNIVIEGGDITANGGCSAAGIGGGHNANCGNILISGGTITASSSMYGAGIGSGFYGSCAGITISGGTVTATGGYAAAGIGGGQLGSCGDITITKDVNVTAIKGDDARNSIGSGGDNRKCGTVTIGGFETGSIMTSPYSTNGMPEVDTKLGGINLTDEEKLEMGEAVELKKTAEGEWTLAEMPDFDIVLEIEYEPTLFELTVGESEHGTVDFTVGSASATQAEKDDVVTLTVIPDKGYSLKNVTVRAYTSWGAAVRARRAPALLDDINMTKQADGTWQFIMPEANVWVAVTYTKDLQDAWILPIASMTYTGEALTPAVVVKDGDITLSAETDYIVTYADNVNVGQATVTVTAKEGADYGGTATATFTITMTTDRTGLYTAISDAETYYKSISESNPDAAAVLLDAINDAKEVLDNDEATQTQIDVATTKLNDIVNAGLAELLLKRITITIPAKSYVARIDEDKRQMETPVEGVSLFSVEKVTETEVELTAPLTFVDAEMPYLIYNDNDEEKTIDIVVSSEKTDKVNYDSEHFKGTLKEKTFTEEDMQAADYYLLADCNDFVWVKDAGTLAAGKCWIELPTTVAHSRQFIIVNKSEQTQTGISSIENGELTTGNWYDLSGRRVARPTKGICVRNGKKVILAGVH